MSDKRYLESESLKDAMWKNFYKEEDKWECTPEADFLDVHGGCPRHWFQLGFGVALDAVVRADPVPTDYDTVSRKAVIDLAMQYCPDDDGSCSRADVDMREMLDELEALPAAPREMTAREYHLIKRRMCKNCPVCPLNEAAINLFIDCKRFEREFPNEAVAIVEEWAREHPEERSEE